MKIAPREGDAHPRVLQLVAQKDPPNVQDAEVVLDLPAGSSRPGTECPVPGLQSIVVRSLRAQ